MATQIKVNYNNQEYCVHCEISIDPHGIANCLEIVNVYDVKQQILMDEDWIDENNFDLAVLVEQKIDEDWIDANNCDLTTLAEKPDALNPKFIFSTTDNTLLIAILNGNLDAIKAAEQELTNRGFDKTGKWIGFKK
jgi:hypothetical protein